MSTLSATQLPLAPLGAGDLIDRAVRLYRRHLFVLIRTAAPPVILATGGWIVFSFSFQRVFLSDSGGALAFYAFLSVVALVVTFGGYLLTLVVMGGASRTLVAHLLRNDPVTARATYRAVRARFWGLIGASLIVLLWITIAFTATFMVWYIVIAMTIFTTFATYSALMILLITRGWYGYLAGVDPFNSANWPAWYAVTYNVLAPLSSILLSPVWMLGLSLLYVDERVRHEGYDIELMAARQLGELPNVDVTSPLGTALSSTERPPAPPSGRRPSNQVQDFS
jgi:hypothetical protein